MITRTKAAIGIGAAVLLWYLWDHLTGPPAVGAGRGPVGESDFKKLFHEYAVGDAVERGNGHDVIADRQPDAIDVLTEQAQLESGQSMAGRTLGAAMYLFHWQVELPASRIRIADLQPYHFQLANAMLAGNMQRNDKAGSLYQRLLDDIAQNKQVAEDLAIADTVVSAVAAVIPVIGGAIAIAAGTGIKEGQKGAIANANYDIAQTQTVGKIKAGLGVGSPAGKAWLSNHLSEFPIDAQWVTGPNGAQIRIASVGLTELYGYWRRDSDQSPVGSAEASYFERKSINGTTADRRVVRDGYSWQRVTCRMKLFSMHRYGWILPWLSPDLGYGSKDPNTGLDTTLTQRIGLRAAVLRAFDLMCCQLDPLPLPADGKPVWTRYWYISKTWGPVFGSVFPPDAESTHFQDGLKKWGYHGEDATQTRITEESTYVTPQLSTQVLSSVTIPGQSTTGDAPPPPTAEDYGQVAIADAAQLAAASVYTAPTGSGLGAARIAKGFR